MLSHLKNDIEWPDLTDIRRWPIGLGGKGRHLVDAVIRDRGAKLLLEFGVFLGASSRYWLDTHPELTVVGVDPWGDDLVAQCERYVGRETLNKLFPDLEDQKAFITDVRQHGVRTLALANLQDYRDRFIPIIGTTPETIPALKAGTVEPDIIFIDADKKPEDLDVAHIFWPDAILTGDDWHWGRTKGYPMRQIVNDFAARHDMTVEADHATWVLKPKK